VGFWVHLYPRWPHSWRGIVAIGYRLLRSNFVRIFRYLHLAIVAGLPQKCRHGREVPSSASPGVSVVVSVGQGSVAIFELAVYRLEEIEAVFEDAAGDVLS
jgi:hypothetical protein